MADRFRALRSPAGLLLGWGALALVVQRWASLEEGIREGYAVDVLSYTQMAEAAPSFPDTDVLRPFAERFPVHWLIGVVSDLTGLSLEDVYRAATVICLTGIVVVLYATLARLELAQGEFALAVGALAASAYPVHYLLAAPGMLTDGVFVLGLAVTLLGFVRGSFPLVAAGLVIGVLGRQTAIPVAIAAAAWIAGGAGWRPVRWSRAAGALLVPGAVYLVVRTVADSFAVPRSTDLEQSTLIGYFDGVGEIADHLGRIVIGIAIPAALVFGAWLRTRRSLPRGPLLLAAAVVVQPLLLGPATNGNNEPRLAGLAAPALAVAAGALLAHARCSRAETAAVAVAIATAGLHPRYTWPLPAGSGVWAVLALAAAVVVVAVLGRRGRSKAAGA